MSSRGAAGVLRKHKYTEVRKIGEGSFGQALLVQAEGGAKLVCKMIDVSHASQKETQDTMKEAQLLAAFKHPFIVEYHACFLDSGWLCILMAFCEGGDLTTQVNIARQARMNIEENQILRWITQALLALQYIHARHVLHRDLKSGNFFLSKAGNLRMGDFGIAKVLTSTQACARTKIGTPFYLSPEVCQEKPYAWPSDIWSMGCILYELCALKVPFDGGNSMVVLVQSICRGTPSPIPDCYSEFPRQLCNEMLNKIPTRRPSASAILGRPRIQRIVQQFFEEAKAKAAQDNAKTEPKENVAENGKESISTDKEEESKNAFCVYNTGDLVEYYSSTHQSWIAAAITGVDGEGSVVLDVKPNSWLSREQQSQQVRPRTGARQAGPCSTQDLERMLDQDASQSAEAAQPAQAGAHPEPRAAVVDATEIRENKAAVGPSDVGHGGPSLNDECSKLLEELGLDGSCDEPGATAPGDAPEAGALSPTASLTQAELDLLNDCL